MQQTHDEQQAPGTGPGAGKARLPGEIIPTALAGPAQKGREPLPIILPHIAIGRAVTPDIPALTAAGAAAVASPAGAYHPTQVLTPVTNEGKGETTGAHEHQPQEEGGAEAVERLLAPPRRVPGQESGGPVINGPIPRPAGLHHRTPMPKRWQQERCSPGLMGSRS